MPSIVYIAGAVVVGLIVFAMLVSLFKSCYLKAGPNEAIVISGGKKHTFTVFDETTGNEVKVKRGWKFIIGGAGFKIPIIQKAHTMSLEEMNIEVKVQSVPSSYAIQVDVDAVANVKINSEGTAFPRAAERFLGKPIEEIHETIKQTLQGQLRDIIGTLTIEQLYKNRQDFVDKVLEQASNELDKLGVTIDIINIQDIKAEKNYLDNIAKQQAAVADRDAKIAEADAERDARKRRALANKEAGVTEAEQEKIVAEANKNRDVAKAQYEAETIAEQKRIEPAGEKAEAIARQEVIKEHVAIEEAKQLAQQKVEEKRILVAEKKYKAETIVPADAQKQAAILTAEGESEAIRLRAKAQADAIKMQGEAEAAAKLAMLEAEAKGFEEKALAFEKYGAAANLSQMLPTYEKIFADLAAAMANVKIDNVAVIDGGNGDGRESGFNRALTYSPEAVLTLFEKAKAVLGFDPGKLIQNLASTAMKGIGEEEKPASRKKVKVEEKSN